MESMNGSATCLGSCCEDDHLSSRSRSTTARCCCCSYDPFEEEDESPESRIRDPSFALRKLQVMRCQTRKWRLERLELESETRSLRLALRAHGVDAQEVLAKPNPLVEHLRVENRRLERRKDELEDEVRDLAETLAEREDGNACDVVSHVREKTLALRHRFAVEKRQLRETIADLQGKLDEAQGDGSCSALNRLRAKLRELTKDDQQVVSSMVVEKSIETLAELTGSCDELRRENERLLGQVEELKKEIKSEAGEKFVGADELVEITDLSKRVSSCESSVTQTRLRLAERDDAINDLQKQLYEERRTSQRLEGELDQMAVSRRALAEEIDAIKAELALKDHKVTHLLRDLRESTVAAQSLGELETELERLRPEVRELEETRDETLDELSRVRQELSARNDQIIEMLEERDKARASVKADLDTATARIQELEGSGDGLRRENEGLATRLRDLEQELEREQQRLSEIDGLRRELSGARAESESLRAAAEELRVELERVELERRTLAESKDELLARLQRSSEDAERLASEAGSLTRERDALADELTRLKDELEAEASSAEGRRKEAATLSAELDELKKAADRQRDEAGSARQENESLSKALKNLENDLKKLEAERDALRSNLKDSESKALDLSEASESLQRKNEELTSGTSALKEALEKASGELEKARSSDEARTKELDGCRVEAAELSREKERLQAALAEAAAHRDRLERELGESKWQADRYGRDMEQVLAAAEETRDKLLAANDEIERLESANAALLAEASRLKTGAEPLEKARDALTAELSSLRKELEAVGAENAELKSSGERLKSETSRARKASIQLNRELGKLQSASKAGSTGGKGEADVARLTRELGKCQAEIERLRRGTGAAAGIERDRQRDKGAGDNGLAKASEALGAQMQSQIEAVNRVREFISYAEGRASSRPEMSTELSPSGHDKSNSSAPEVIELFERSRKLSEAILDAEREVQSLDKLKSAQEDEPSMNENQETAQGDSPNAFDASAWLQSLTLTQLAELHDRVCLLTSNMVQDDEAPYDEDEDESREVVNVRIAALQRRIAERQREAEARANAMRRTLLQEQARLIGISDEVNRERELNFAMRLSSVDARATPKPPQLISADGDGGAPTSARPACCAREDCLRAGCTATSGDFDPRRRK